MRVANAGSRGLLETPGPTPTRSALNERDVDGQTRPIAIPAVDWRPEPLKLDPKLGGCTRCWHVEGGHRRGKDTPRRCTGSTCDCAGYKRLWTWRDWLQLAICLVLFGSAFAEIAIAVAATW
jgi:hypothetical protein